MTENERLIEAGCLRLRTRYGNSLDRRDMDAFGRVFREDAVWRRTNVREVELSGREEIVKHVARLPEGVVNRHTMTTFLDPGRLPGDLGEWE